MHFEYTQLKYNTVYYQITHYKTPDYFKLPHIVTYYTPYYNKTIHHALINRKF